MFDPRTGYVMELTLGILSLLLWFVVGTAGGMVLLLFGFRLTFFNDREGEQVAELRRRVFRISLAATIIIFFIVLFREFRTTRTIFEWVKLSVPFLPLYFALHGGIGLILYHRFRESHPEHNF